MLNLCYYFRQEVCYMFSIILGVSGKLKFKDKFENLTKGEI